VQARKIKGKKQHASKHAAGSESEEEWERGCLACSTVNGFWETAHRCSWAPIGRTSFSVKTPPPAFCSTTITSGDGEKRTEGRGGREPARERVREREDRSGKCGFRLPEHAIATRSFIYPAKRCDSIQIRSFLFFPLNPLCKGLVRRSFLHKSLLGSCFFKTAIISKRRYPTTSL